MRMTFALHNRVVVTSSSASVLVEARLAASSSSICNHPTAHQNTANELRNPKSDAFRCHAGGGLILDVLMSGMIN